MSSSEGERSSSRGPHSAVEQVTVAAVSLACEMTLCNDFAAAETGKRYKKYGLKWKANIS